MLITAFSKAAGKQSASSMDMLSLILSERPDLKGKMVYSPEQGNNAWTLIVGDEVFKAPRHEKQLEEFGREVRILREAAGQGLPVPEVTYVGKHKHFFGMKRVPGVTLVPEYLTEQELERLACDLADFKVRMENSFPVQKPVSPDRVRGRDALGLFDVARVRQILQRPSVMEKTAACRLFHEAMEPYLKKAEGRHVMIHGDLRPENIMIDPETKKLTAVIDLGVTHYGLPEMDIFGLRLSHTEAFIESVSREYAYKSASGFCLGDIPCYEAAVFADYYARESAGASEIDRARAEAEVVQFIHQTEKSLQSRLGCASGPKPQRGAGGGMRPGG